MKMGKLFFYSILWVPLLIVLYLNMALWYSPTFAVSESERYNRDVYQQLLYLQEKMHKGTATDIQAIFPEGFIFQHALYGLTWSELIENLPTHSSIYKIGMEEINWSLASMSSDEGKAVFDPKLPLEYGAFYRGWSNYLLGKKLLIQGESDRDSSEVNLFLYNCRSIIHAVKKSESPFLESYRSQVWPADMMVAIASVDIAEELGEMAFREEVAIWVERIGTNLDKETGLVAHSSHINGMPSAGARGDSQSLMLNFMIDIDEDFAREQFEIYKSLFWDERLGLPGIREHPKSKEGGGDIDSGPVIWGIGGAASIVGQRTMAKYGENDIYVGLRNSIEAFGAAYSWGGKKRYVFGQLPMADAFIAWANVSESKEAIVAESYWRGKFQLLSLLMLTLLGGGLWWWR